MRLLAAILALFLVTPAWAEQGAFNAPTNQAYRARVVTPSDTVNLPLGRTLGVRNGGATACDIAVILYSDTAAVTYGNVQPGATEPMRALRVMAANTTCTDILALY